MLGNSSRTWCEARFGLLRVESSRLRKGNHSSLFREHPQNLQNLISIVNNSRPAPCRTCNSNNTIQPAISRIARLERQMRPHTIFIRRMLVLLPQLFKNCFPPRSCACCLQEYANSIMSKKIVSSVQVSSLLISVVILNCFPISTTW
jgi:hypothetical protein